MELPRPFLLFLGDVKEPGYAKTALGLRDWAPEHCIGEYAFPGALTIGLPQLLPREAKAAGARSLVIGVANPGGVIPGSWIPALSRVPRRGAGSCRRDACQAQRHS